MHFVAHYNLDQAEGRMRNIISPKCDLSLRLFQMGGVEMYSVGRDLDGYFVLTFSGLEMAFWFSDFRYKTRRAALRSPDRNSFFRQR
jgi:hypothetical protein